MVPERQAFHPSQQAVKAVADSTVLRPRRSRAKYRDNKTVEVKPSRPATRKRRCLSRTDSSLSESKTSDGSESCLEVPASCGPKVTRSRGSEVRGTRGAQAAKSHGLDGSVIQGLSNPVVSLAQVTQKVSKNPIGLGSNGPVTLVLPNPMSQGSRDQSQDPMSQGSIDPVTLVSENSMSLGKDNPVTLASENPVSHGSGSIDPVTLVSQNPMSQGKDNSVTLVSPNPMSQGSLDPVTLVSQNPTSQGKDNPVSLASENPTSQDSQDKSQDPVTQNLEVLISEFKRMKKGKTQVEKPPKQPPRKTSNPKVTLPKEPKEPPIRSTKEARNDFGCNERLLMRQWLESEADGGRIPGLQWLDKQDRLIRVNWRHGSRAEWSTGDVTVFKCWAQHTGRYNSKEPDFKRWKANFRCAVNSLPDVQEVKERRGTKAGDPYKVYKLLPAILPRKRRRESVKSARCSSPENSPAAMETSTPTYVATAEPKTEPKMEPEPGPSVEEPPLSPELFLQLMPLPSGSECEPVITWSSGGGLLDGVPVSTEMENLMTLDVPLMCLDQVCYTTATNGMVAQRQPSLTLLPQPRPQPRPRLARPPPPPSPPQAAAFNNAIPLPVQNLMDSDDSDDEEDEKEEPLVENLENELNIGELFNLVDVQANSISSTNDSAVLDLLQALFNQNGIIISN